MSQHDVTVASPSVNGSPDSVGWETQQDRLTGFPFINDLFFADKKDLHTLQHETVLTEIHKYLVQNRDRYLQFLRQKSRHPTYDIYACFQPFNEAFKAMFPLVDYIGQHLKPGDIILNLWDRSGWTASMLAGWFPDQKIVTVWESNSDILGYKGFDYWMSPQRRKNHAVYFTDFEKPLPFAEDSIGAVVGLDVLHRFSQPELIAEVNRVARKSAPIIFPHVHLTNNMPEPFFERGCRQLHGRDYQKLFDNVEQVTGRRGYVLSEPATFLWNDLSGDNEKVLISAPENTDYNATVAWLPVGATPPVLKPWRGHENELWPDMFLLQNPLLQIDPCNNKIEIRTQDWGFDIHEFLGHHPIYMTRVKDSIGLPVDEITRCVLYWASQGYKLSVIMEKMGLGKTQMEEILKFLWTTDLAQAVPVDFAGFRLQTLLGYQKYIPEVPEQQLDFFWKQTVVFHKNNLWCKSSTGEELNFEQADELVQIIKKGLLAEDLAAGDKLLLVGNPDTEQLLTFWAAASIGVVIVPLSAKLAGAKVDEYLQLVEPKFALVDPELVKTCEGACKKVVMTYKPESPDFVPERSFVAWMEAAAEKEITESAIPNPGNVAAILFTTGSTGDPKGIPVTHSQLIRSGRVMTETYQWKSSDKYYVLGGLETMSGLRHATVSTAEVGAACIIPTAVNNIFGHAENLQREEITIITANPAFFKQLLTVMEKRKLKLNVRLALCTGNQLSEALTSSWNNLTGLPLYNYYGLTETGGICIAPPLDAVSRESTYIGKPVDCLVKIVDETGQVVQANVPGELCIYGAGIFSGYFNNEAATTKVLNNGWFHTGDIATMDSAGNLTLQGRKSNIIKLPGGERIELTAIEEIVEPVKGVADSAVCPLNNWEKEGFAVFYVPDSFESVSEINNRIRESLITEIGAFAVPLINEPVKNIPRGHHNKILRQELLENYFELVKEV